MDDLFATAPTGRPVVRTLSKLRINGLQVTPETLPAGGVYIGRHWLAGRVQWPETIWRNDYDKRYGTIAERLALFEAKLCGNPELMAALPELRSRDLWCWCSPLPCHGDVLLALAND